MPQAEEFKYLRVFFTSAGRMERECSDAVVMKKELRPVDLRSCPHLLVVSFGK